MNKSHDTKGQGGDDGRATAFRIGALLLQRLWPAALLLLAANPGVAGAGFSGPGFMLQRSRQVQFLHGEWEVCRIEADHELSLGPRDPDAVSRLGSEALERADRDCDWDRTELPAVLNPAPDRYQGAAVYRTVRAITAPERGDVRPIMVFQGANHVTDMWIDGAWVGSHKGGFIPFSLDPGDKLAPGSEAEFRLRIDNPPWPEDKNTAPERCRTLPCRYADWWNYGGPYRDLYIQWMPRAAVADLHFRLDPAGSGDAELIATLTDDRDEKTPLQLSFDLFEARLNRDNMTTPWVDDLIASEPFHSMTVIASPEAASGEPVTIRIPSEVMDRVGFWSPETPNLLAARAELADDNGRRLDSYSIQTGKRLAAAEDQWILLNREPVLLKGASRHEDLPGDKAAALTWFDGGLVLADLQLIKDAGMNFFRSGHYPNHPLTFMIADRIGLMSAEELPAYWMNDSMFREVLDSGEAEAMWRSMIARDRNSPSVIIWSACNESSGFEVMLEFLQTMKSAAQEMDGTRLFMHSGLGFNPFDPTHAPADVVGVTMYFGVFNPEPPHEGSLRALKRLRGMNKGKPIVITEFGVWAGLTPTGDDRQVEIFEETFRALRELPYVAGAVWWTAFDYRSYHNHSPDSAHEFGLWSLDRGRARPVLEALEAGFNEWVPAQP